MTQPFHVLFVCSANLCRSVTAAAMARRAVHDRSTDSIEWYFGSAGTDVFPGQRLPRDVARTMRDLGIPFRSQPRIVTEEYVRTADLVLTAERYHRGVVAQRFPFAVRYSYTLLQFARLLEAGREAMPTFAVASGSDLHELARIGRSHVQPNDDVSVDIGDPVEAGTSAAMLTTAAIIEAAVRRVVV